MREKAYLSMVHIGDYPGHTLNSKGVVAAQPCFLRFFILFSVVWAQEPWIHFRWGLWMCDSQTRKEGLHGGELGRACWWAALGQTGRSTAWRQPPGIVNTQHYSETKGETWCHTDPSQKACPFSKAECGEPGTCFPTVKLEQGSWPSHSHTQGSSGLGELTEQLPSPRLPSLLLLPCPCLFVPQV